MPLSELYQSALLAHNRHPRRHHELTGATHTARGTDALCGDDIRVWLRLEDGRVADASWSGEACAVTTAAASMLTEWLPGRTPGQLRAGHEQFARLLDDPEAPRVPDLGDLNLLRAVGGFPSRKRNALLPWHTALRAANSD